MNRSLPRVLFIAVAWVALTVSFFFPTKAALDATLDYSNYASYSYFSAERMHYGSEVVPMCGPYGFVMYGFVHSGYLVWTRLVLELAVKAVLAALVLWFWNAARRAPALRWLWLASIPVFMCGIEDYPEDWFILLGGFFIIRQLEEPKVAWRAALMAVGLSFVALIKGTHLVLALATLGGALLPALARWDWKRLATIAGSFLVGLLFWWLVAGQHPGDLSAYVKGILELSSGYNAAMVIDEATGTFVRGVSLLVALLVFCAYIAWTYRRNIGAVSGALLLAGFTFVKWKHGYVRADGHIFMFFSFGAVAAWTWLLLVPALSPEARPPAGWPHRVAVVLSAGVVLLCFFGFGDGPLRNSTWAYELYPGLWRGRADALRHVSAEKTRLDAELATHRRYRRLPQTRERVGTASVDMFGFDHGITLLNDLNYRPRPVGGGTFSTFTPYLMELNGAAMRDPARRPEYFLLKVETLDNRFAAQDDPLTLRSLIHTYTPLLVEQSHLLLQAKRNTAEPALEKLRTVTFRFNDTVKVPDVRPDQLLLASFDIPPSTSGRLRTALYKPPLVFMTLLGRDLLNGESRRLVPGMATLPMPLSPVIETADDILGLYTLEAGKTLYEFRLNTNRPEAYAPELTVTFYAQPRPAAPERVDVAELHAQSRYSFANVRPDAVVPVDSPQTVLRMLDRLDVQMLTPPSELQWKLEGTEREFTFDYGYDPSVFDKGSGDGTDFVVEIRGPNKATRELLRESLDPSHRPADRGLHSARVTLPAVNAGSRLVLRADPGKAGDISWDWSYVTNLQLRRAPYAPERFPNFNRVPTAGDTGNGAIIDSPYGRILQLHAPSSLTYRLAGNETRLSFDYGILPGAYTGEGATDGAVFLVELRRPNQPVVTLLRRHLEPRTHKADQGLQHADLPLPKLGAADRLIVTLDPGPAGSNAWDWTFISRFELK